MADDLIQQLIADLRQWPPEKYAAMSKTLLKETETLAWFRPNTGRQTEAYICEADILLYGGAGGGGKTFLELGLSQEHRSAIIFRRAASQLDGLERGGKEIFGDANYNGSKMEWSWPDGRSLKLAGMKDPEDWRKHAGRERDLIEFDEAGEFLEIQVASLLGWLRGPPGQRARMVLGSNPPRSSDGYWLIKWFAPWLDRTFPNPPQPGELRYAMGFGDKDIQWVDGPTPVNGGERPLSVTFIPALLTDNPYRDNPEYRANLNALPEPLRSQMMLGDFTAGHEDTANQVIPTDWIIAAQERWTPRPPQGEGMTAMALDPAGGGQDSAEISCRYGGWYAPLISETGEATADGSTTASTVVKHRRDDCTVVVDVGGGYGGAVMLRLRDNGIECVPFNGSNSSTRKTRDRQLSFANKRAEAWWLFAEALNPDQEGGSVIALPPDPELRADLAAPTWELTSGAYRSSRKSSSATAAKLSAD